MPSFLRRRLQLTLLGLLFFLPFLAGAQVSIVFDQHLAPVAFGVNRLEEALKKSGLKVQKTAAQPALSRENIIIRVMIPPADPALQKEGYRIHYRDKTLLISAIDAAGAMYGTLDVAEQIKMGRAWQTLTSKKVNPRLTVRALKFNLPWSSYRSGPAMDTHLAVSRDLAFWQRFLDQMAENRFNVLSLWNIHPFSFMVKPTNFPEANNFSPQEMAQWKHFWTSLFRMAKDRGIEPFIVNWNIAVSPEFAQKYGVQERNDTSAIVKRYTREVVTQVIDEYPDLAGIGITLADWMSNFKSQDRKLPEMTPKDREDWIEETVVAGIKAARRPVKLLHRSVLSANPQEMRRVIDNARLPDTTLVEIKFNWSHGHSTPVLAMTHDSHSGQRDDGYWNPLPDNYRIQWMVRNEDFFILRWGQADFIRRHIAQNTHPYVNGYFVGSEGYIPAQEFAHTANAHRTWNYAFEKQWLFYQLWGRLLYDPSTPDAVFEAAFKNRYHLKSGRALFRAYAAASQMPLRLASFYAATWDYTLYSEGFLAPFPANSGFHDDVSSFISIEELIDHPTLDPDYISIPGFVKASLEKKTLPAGKVSPLALADSLAADSRQVLSLVKQLRPQATATLACELDDLATWAYLSSYFADKLRAGVALHRYRVTGEKSQQQEAVDLLTRCLAHWEKVSQLTASHYREVPYIEGYKSGGNAYKDAGRFSWTKYLPQVKRDITLAREAKLLNK
jgi:Glycosyl hydrolase family 20, domain 2